MQIISYLRSTVGCFQSRRYVTGNNSRLRCTKGYELRNPDMDLKGLPGTDRRPLQLKNIARSVILCALLNLTGCTYPGRSYSRDQAEPKQNPQVQREKKNDWTFPACPVGDIKKGGSTDHKVTLTWNASTSSDKSKEIRYCLYRSRDRRVGRITGELTVDKAPCTKCELVTDLPVPGTTIIDHQVQNEARYCYAAVAIQFGNQKFSEFSNQAEADVPDAKHPGSNKNSTGTLCKPEPQHRKTTPNRSHR